MSAQEILGLVYLIQCASDPNHPEKTDRERLEQIYDMACRIMNETGFHPQD